MGFALLAQGRIADSNCALSRVELVACADCASTIWHVDTRLRFVKAVLVQAIGGHIVGDSVYVYWLDVVAVRIARGLDLVVHNEQHAQVLHKEHVWVILSL